MAVSKMNKLARALAIMGLLAPAALATDPLCKTSARPINYLDIFELTTISCLCDDRPGCISGARIYYVGW